ncbi:MAG: hypothetical protein KDB22_06540 [Planctomycetales bacterium]|nr:hypothetical protein [Planctomycetales bacterium]
MHIVGTTLLAFAIFTGGELPPAEEASQPQGTTEADVAARAVELVRQLAAPNYQVRRKAFLDVWRFGPAALPALHEAAESEDLQLSHSARVLEVMLRLNLPLEEQQDSLRLLALLSEPKPETIYELCRRGRWDIALQILQGNLQDLTTKFKSPAGALQIRRIAELALQQGDPALAWPIIRLLIDLPLSSWLSARNGLAPTDLPANDVVSAAIQEFYRGDSTLALDARIPPHQRLELITRSGQWQALLDKPIQDALLDSTSPLTRRAALALLHDYAGQVQSADEVWQQLAEETLKAESKPQAQSSDKQPGEPAESLIERAALELLRRERAPAQLLLILMSAGYERPIEEFLIERDPAHAFVYLLGNSRFAEAFQAVDLEPDLSNFDTWLEERRQLIAEVDTSPFRTHYNQSARLCSVLLNLGYPDHSRRLFQMLEEFLVSRRKLETRGNQIQVEWELWNALFDSMSRADARQLFLERFRENYAQIPNDIRTIFVRLLFPEVGKSALTLLESYKPTRRPEVFSPDAWDALEHLYLLEEEYFGDDAAQQVSSWLNRTRIKLGSEPSGDQLGELATLALGFGLVSQAYEFALDDSATDGSHRLEAAKLMLRDAMPREASQQLAELRNSYYSQYQHQLIGMEIDTLLQAGDFEFAEKLERFRWILPHLEEAQATSYASVGQYLRQQEDHLGAIEYFEPAFLISQLYRASSLSTANSYAASLHEVGQFGRSADVRRALLVESMKANTELQQVILANPRGYEYLGIVNYIAHKERMSRAMDCIERGKFDEAWRNIQIGQSIQPQDIEMVEECYPLLVSGGQQALADQLFDAFESTMLDHMKQWPRDATALNNLAWMYAQCDRKLDEALELSRQAVSIAPRSAVFLDTLAEIQFRRGDNLRSLETVKQCIKLDPRESHYRKNLVRFSPAD